MQKICQCGTRFETSDARKNCSSCRALIVQNPNIKRDINRLAKQKSRDRKEAAAEELRLKNTTPQAWEYRLPQTKQDLLDEWLAETLTAIAAEQRIKPTRREAGDRE